jgi:hypothetical protein
MMIVVLEENEGGTTDKDKRVQSYIHTQIIGCCRIDIVEIVVEICNYPFPVEPIRPSHTRMRPTNELYGC